MHALAATASYVAQHRRTQALGWTHQGNRILAAKKLFNFSPLFTGGEKIPNYSDANCKSKGDGALACGPGERFRTTGRNLIVSE